MEGEREDVRMPTRPLEVPNGSADERLSLVESFLLLLLPLELLRSVAPPSREETDETGEAPVLLPPRPWRDVSLASS